MSGLLSKLREINSTTRKGILEIIARRGRGKIETIIEKVKEIKNQMRRTPQNIEGLFDLKQSLEDKIDHDISDLSGRILKCREIFEVLEERHFQAESDDLTRLWKLFCLPEELELMKKNKLDELNTMKGVFFLELMNQQADFTENIGDTEGEITMLCNYKTIVDLEEVTEKIKDISRKIENIKQRVEVFNKREKLLERNPTDYSMISKLEGSFLVYKELWNVIQNWVDRDVLQIENKEGLKQLENKLNGFLTYFNEKKNKQTLKLIEMIEGIKGEVKREML